VLARRPDWILTPRKPMPERLRERWRNVPAVKRGQFVEASADDLVRAGPRLLDGLARLADTLLGAASAGDEK
jgi:ABC-type Fe3+-hydroxamate transport system substrate-binding protein